MPRRTRRRPAGRARSFAWPTLPPSPCSAVEIAGERCAQRGGQCVDRGAILGMIDARGETRSTLHCAGHRTVELEAQEMDRGGLLPVLALEVLIGDGMNARMALDLDPDPVF